MNGEVGVITIASIVMGLVAIGIVLKEVERRRNRRRWDGE